MDTHPIRLTQGHIDQHTLPWRKDSRQHFPNLKPGMNYRVVDSDTSKVYRGHHDKTNGWISRLKGFYDDHPTLTAQDTVSVTIDPDGTVRLADPGAHDSPSPDASGHIREWDYSPGGRCSIPRDLTYAPLESLVEDAREADPTLLETGLRLHKHGRQFQAGGGRIDLLCVDKNDRFVVVEIKRWKGDDQAIGQILNYMAWVRRNLANGTEVRGFIVAHDEDERLENAVTEVRHAQIKYYRMKLEIVPREVALGPKLG